MSLSKLSLKPSLRLTAVSLALTLAGCGGTQPAYDSASTPVSSGSTYEPPQRTYSPPEPYQPRVERMSDPVPLASGAPNEYVVQVGDTLWDIAATFLRDPWYWPEIWHINDQIENPHLIYPGDVLGLVYIDGEPRITNVRASTYRLSPQARITPLSESITSIPYEDVARIPSRFLLGIEINDGTLECPWSLHEDTINHRDLPGEGEFDVKGFVKCMLDAGYDGPWGVEVLSQDLRKEPMEAAIPHAFRTTIAQFPGYY